MKKTALILLLIGTTVSINSVQANWVVIDGSRNFSHAMALHLIDQGEPCTLVVKPDDMPHIEERFEHKNMLDIVEFDYTQEVDFSSKEGAIQLKPLLDAMRGKKFLYLDPEHHKYSQWHEVVRRIALNTLFCAQIAKLNIIYAARIYPFSGPDFTYSSATDKVRISHTHQPTVVSERHRTEQGKTLIAIEEMIRTVANNPANECKAIMTRLPYLFGPGANDYLLSSTFKEVPKIGRMTWLFDIDKPYQFCFTPDAARLAYELSKQEWSDNFSCVTFKGYELESVRTFGERICEQANALNMHPEGEQITLNPRVVSKLQLRAVSLFKHNAKRGIDLAEFFTSPRKLSQNIDFSPTPLEEALQTTLRWYEKHNNVITDVETRGIFQP